VPDSPAGSGGSGSGGGSQPAPVALPGGDVEADILAYIQSALKGSPSGYTDEVLAALTGKAKREEEGRRAADTEGFNEDLAGRNLFRSGIAARGALGIRNEASARYSGRVQGIYVEKQRQDAQMKLQYIGLLEKWLADRRDYLLRKEGNDIQRQIGLAQITLGYAKLAQEKELLLLQLHSGGGGGGESTCIDYQTGQSYPCPPGY
jgi:hypothetical protein